MLRTIVVLALVLVWWLGQPTLAVAQYLEKTHPKFVVAKQVFDDIARAVGDGRTRPILQLVRREAPVEKQIAWYNPATNAVIIEETVYDLCVAQGADSLNALAVLLGHELAHYYMDHGWVGDFGRGFADMEVGQDILEARQSRQQLVTIEAEADIFGGFYSYLAGYNTLDVAAAILTAIYLEYDLDEGMHGYPSLAERGEIAQRCQNRLERLVPIFEAGNRLLLLGHYKAAAASFDHIGRTFPSREILNNAAVARLRAAVEHFGAGESGIAYPFESDPRTRLQRARSGATAKDETAVSELFAVAEERLEAARRKDPAYAPVYVNLSCLAALRGDGAQALHYAEEALRHSGKNLVTKANGQIARGIARLHGTPASRGAAEGDFVAAAAANSALAKINLALLRGESLAADKGARPERDTGEYRFGAGVADYQALFEAPDRVAALSGAGEDGGAMTVFYKEGSGWRAWGVDTGRRQVAFWQPSIAGARPTGRGIVWGQGQEAVEKAYGTPSRIVAQPRATYQVYEKPSIAFKLGTDNLVEGWLVYDVDEDPDRPERHLARDEGQANLGLAGGAAPSPAGKRLALVVGNSAYKQVPLPNAANDAKAMSQALRQCNFEVIEVVDAGRRALRRAVRDFGRGLESGGVGLFYYAGHGVQVEGQNYLVPVGSDIVRQEEVADEGVLVSSVVSNMEKADSRVNIIILDACRNNPFAGRFRSQQGGLAGMEAPTGSLVAYATGPGKVAADGEGDHGLFTDKLLKYIHQPGLDLLNLFLQVRREVAKASGGAQVPWEENSLMGKFYFVPPEGEEVLASSARGGLEQGKMAYVRDFGFYLDTFEVTNQQFATFLNQEGNRVEDQVAWLDTADAEVQIEKVGGTYRALSGYEKHPVVEVTWHGARAYCAWADKRLPKAKEWKQAYGDLDGRAYPWGDSEPGKNGFFRANFDQAEMGDGYRGSAPVGSFAAGISPYGAQDMAGNVWEWVDEADGRQRRRLMGGSWANGTAYLHPSHDYWSDPSLSFDNVGFRCARNP